MTFASTEGDSIQLIKIAGIFRAVRGQLGYSQPRMAPLIGMSQSGLSKIERAQSTPSAMDLLSLANLAGISLESFETGIIERVDQTDFVPKGGFEIPAAYSEGPTIRARGARILLGVFNEVLGERRLKKFLAQHWLDTDYLVDLDHGLNFQFSMDVADELSRSKDTQEAAIAAFPRVLFTVGQLGAVPTSARRIEGPLPYVRHWAERLDRFSSSFKIDVFERPDLLTLSVNPSWEIGQFDYRHLSGFFCSLRKAAIQEFLRVKTGAHQPVIERECLAHGGVQCVYQIAA